MKIPIASRAKYSISKRLLYSARNAVFLLFAIISNGLPHAGVQIRRCACMIQVCFFNSKDIYPPAGSG